MTEWSYIWHGGAEFMPHYMQIDNRVEIQEHANMTSNIIEQEINQNEISKITKYF